MKLAIVISLLIGTLVIPSVSEVRGRYMEAATTEAVAKDLNLRLKEVKVSDSPTLLAYKGAVMTMMAKYTRNKSEKKDFFKSGVAVLEAAISSDPKNIEIRVIRLSIQENAPKFLRYYKNIPEDKDYILEHYKEVRDTDLKGFISDFVRQSSEFGDQEKAGF